TRRSWWTTTSETCSPSSRPSCGRSCWRAPSPRRSAPRRSVGCSSRWAATRTPACSWPASRPAQEAGACSPRSRRVPPRPRPRRTALGEPVELVGPGVLAFDGDRERKLASGQRARVSVLRDGPFVIDVGRALHFAAERGTFLDRAPWRDAYDEH